MHACTLEGVCAYLRKVNLAWLYIESRPAISPLIQKVQDLLATWKVSQSALYIFTPFIVEFLVFPLW